MKRGNEKNKPIKEAFNYLLSQESQSKDDSLGFKHLKGDNLLKSRTAVERI